MREQQPEVLYYYGHGVGDRRKTRLVFTNQHGKRIDVPMVDVAQCLRQMDRPPAVAYVNCCLGDAGGLLGAGQQLSTAVPAVVTNRTMARISASQKQAKHFWRAVLLEGQAPHHATSEMYGHLGDLGFGFRDARWMTPVLHRHYDTWESHPPKANRRIEDPHWHVKIDRVQQFGQVFLQAKKMLLSRRPPCLAYLWYGQEGQGIEHFHQRLKVELRDLLDDHHLYEVRPRWPDDLANPYRSYEDMMLEAFEVTSLDDVPARIRAETQGEEGRDIIVYIRHEPVRKGEVMRPDRLKSYLEWWDDVFATILHQAPAFGLLGTSFVVSKPADFLAVLKKRGIEDIELRQVVFDVLNELEQLVKKDLTNFLGTHKIALPRDHKDRILADILKKTQGHYELTLEELRGLVHRALGRARGRSSGRERRSGRGRLVESRHPMKNYPFKLVDAGRDGPLTERELLRQRPFNELKTSFAEEAELYVPGDELETAINTALAVGEPLLITGEPGTGKTQAAYYAARNLGVEPVIHFQVKSESTAGDLLYHFDTVRYFHDATCAKAKSS